MDEEKVFKELDAAYWKEEARRRKWLFWKVLLLGIAMGFLLGWIAGTHVADTTVVIPLEQGIET